VININNISFAYSQNKQVLNNISFSLKKGKTLAIVGASGCGKSTLLRVVSGILPNNANNSLQGDITINNQTSDDYRKTGKLAFMFQEATLMPNLTVKDNISLPFKLKGQKYPQRVSDLIKIVGLEDAENYLPKQLSGGMKTRVALARSFVTNPELLLLDEPFSALDIAWKSKLYVELEKLREVTDPTILIVTHDVQESLLLADHVIILNSLGTVETSMDIISEYSIMDRVINITSYMNSVYEKYMIPIQEAIINGQNRENEK
jgi:ABC-type nitrate/sulfonate/bicarbonate transport system ATPase subunit